jgi:fermentation-respiration switch protein FrsA (DUF1100 family)
VLGVLLTAITIRAQSPDPVGLWEGAIDTPAPLQVAVRLARTEAAVWSGTIDIPAQGAKALPLQNISLDGSAVRFTIAGIPGNPTFTGTLSEDGASIAGTFTQGPATLRFTLRRNTTGASTIAAPARPQEPKPPFPYDVEEVTVENPLAGVRLAGTLTLPRGTARHPAVVLISGSGAQDRDETIAGHKPFLVLADHLTRHGIGVLRLDDRGVGGSTGDPRTATSEDFASDVIAALGYLAGHTRVDGAKLGLIGHSEGGIIAPMVAMRSKDVAFQVLLAGSGVTGEQLLYEQMAHLGRAQGASPEQLAAARAQQERLYEIVRIESDPTVMRDRLRALNGEASAQALTLPWFRFFLTYDPATTLRRVTVPTLALNGEKDVQVPYEQNLPAIKTALEAGGNRDVTVRSFPALNHLFQTSRTGLPAEYGQIEETMAPVVLDTVTDWITARVR